MKAKKENNRIRTGVFLILYCLFTMVCGSLSWVLPEQRITLFQLWYMVTTIIWLILVVIAVILTIKLLKLNKLRNKLNHWRD